MPGEEPFRHSRGTKLFQPALPKAGNLGKGRNPLLVYGKVVVIRRTDTSALLEFVFLT